MAKRFEANLNEELGIRRKQFDMPIIAGRTDAILLHRPSTGVSPPPMLASDSSTSIRQ